MVFPRSWSRRGNDRSERPAGRFAARGAVRAGVVCVVYLLAAVVGCAHRNPADAKTESLRRGDELVAKKQYAEATAAYRSALDADPNDGRARMKLADTYALAGKASQASTESQRAADLLPGDLDVQLRAASLMLLDGSFSGAAKRGSAILLAHPESAAAHIVWGNATAQLYNSTWALYALATAVSSPEQYKRELRQLRPDTPPAADQAAEEAFRKALDLAPTLTEAQFALVNILWVTNRLDESEALLKRLADDNPGHATANQALASFYLLRNRGDEAERYLKNAAATGEYGRSARFELVNYYRAKNRDDDALKVLTSMNAADDESGAVSLPTAEIHFRRGRPDEALRRIEALLAREPHNARAVLLKARLLFASRDFPQAVRFARSAVFESPQSGDARSLLGQALVATGDQENAFQAFTEALRLDPLSAIPPRELARLSLALGRDDVVLQYARQAVRRDPADRDAALLLVKALVRTRDYAAADRELEPLLSRSPVASDVLVQLGNVQAARGNREAARTAFERALASDGGSLDALKGLVSLDLKDGRLPAARQRADAAAAAHPQDPGYLVLAAQVYAAADETSRAQQTLRHVLDIDRTNVGAALTLADLLTRQRRLGEARQILEQLLGRQPRSVEAQTSLGMVLEQMGRGSEARARYKAILVQDPRAAVAGYRLAALYVNQDENIDTAFDLAVMAKQQLPDDPAVSDTLGWVYLRKNLAASALPHLQDAVRAVPSDPVYHYHLGAAYVRAGQLQKALSELTRALELDQSFPQADDARTALESVRKMLAK